MPMVHKYQTVRLSLRMQLHSLFQLVIGGVAWLLRLFFSSLMSTIMARIAHGIIGNIRGKIGSIQGASWKKINYIQGRVTLNGHSTSNKALLTKDKFGNCRHVLSQLKSDWMEIIVGKGTKKLPAWQAWVKMAAPNFNRHYDLWVSTAIVCYGDYHPAPDMVYHSSTVVGGELHVEVDLNNPAPSGTSRLSVALWSRSLGVFVHPFDSKFGFLPAFGLVVPYDVSMGHEFVVLAFFWDAALPQVISNSGATRFSF